MKYAILLCLAACALAQEPRPCESPKQWESRIFTVDRSKQYTQMGRLSYDETNQRVRVIEEVEIGSDKDYYDVLFLHNIRKEYRLNLKTRQCNVTDLNRPFRPYGLPPFAKFVFEANIGAAGIPGESMVVQTWDGEFENGDKFESTVTFPDCIPVNFAFYSNQSGLVMNNFFDINLGIADPMVFIPPSECNRI